LKTLKQLRGDQRGMTLVEVVTALVLFAVVFLILFYGINSALKVMNNANAINNATQSNASGLETLGTTLQSKATLTNLSDRLTIGDKAINGTFKKATTAKSNDNTEMSLYLFDPIKLTGTVPTPVMPTPTTPVEKTVVVPAKGKAYYSPDSDLNNITFLSSQGEYQQWQLSGTYSNKYGKLAIGVSTQQLKPQYLVKNLASEYLQQLYFLNSEPFVFTGDWDGGFVYHVDFAYIGDGINNTVTTIPVVYFKENDGTYSIQGARSFTIQSYTSGQTAILYLPQDWNLTTKPVAGNGAGAPDVQTYTIAAGYYEIPVDVSIDFLKAAYDETARNTILSYKKSYSDVKDRLTELGITTQ
jgi:prepilin-type N-terminal cleavage/methylation domain-containing protein